MNARAALGGPVFLARTGLRAGGRETVLAALVIGVTAFLVSLGPLWFGQVADDVLRERLASATEARRGLEFELRGRLEPGAADPLAAVAAEAAALTSGIPPSVAAAATSPDALVDSTELIAIGAPRPILRMTLRMQDVGDDVRWVAGRAPGATTSVVEVPDRPVEDGMRPRAVVYEAAISTQTAEETGLAVGDRVLMVPGTRMPGFIALDVVGLFEEIDPADGRWFSDGTLARPVNERVSAEVTIRHAVALVDPGVYPVLHGDAGTPGSVRLPFRYRWRYRLDPAALAVDRSEVLAAELARLRATHPFGTGGATPGLSTGLADLVDDYRDQRAAASTTIAVALVGPLAAMLGMLAVVVATDQRRRAAAAQAVRWRGGGAGQAVAGRVLETAATALPAALLGGLVAGLVVGTDPAAGLGPALGIGLAAVALAAVAAVAASRQPTVGRDLGPGGRRADRRLVLDLLVIAIAVGGAVSLRGRGQGLDANLDVLLAAAVPVLIALAGGIVVLRAYPAVVRLVARAAAARSDLVAVHALRGVERGAAGHEVPLLALVLAIATGTFAALVVGTLQSTTERAAAEQVGADVRVEQRIGADLPATLDLVTVPGVVEVAPASRAEGRLAGAGPLSVPVRVVILDVPAWLRVVDGLQLGLPRPAELAEPPLLDAGDEASPVPALVGAETLARLGIAPGEVGRLTVGGRTIAVRAAGTADQVPGLGQADELVVVDRAAVDVALPGVGRDPSLVFVRAATAAEPALVAEVDRYAPAVVLASRGAVLRDLEAAPLGVAVRTGFGAAIVVALLYAVAVVAFAAHQATAARRRELAVLRALGLPARGLTGVLAVEVALLVVAALAAGIGLGTLVAALVVPDLALGRLVGQAGATPIAGDPRVLLAFALAPLAGAGAALLAGVVAIRRFDLADATRAVET